MRHLEQFKDMKYYEVHWSGRCYDGTYWGGMVDKFATREEADKCVEKQQKRDSGYSYTIEEKSILELIEKECKWARDDERTQVSIEKCEYYKKYWKEEYEKIIAKEKQILQQEMKNILLNWFNIQTEVKV